MSKLYTFAEVSKHNNQNSTWVVIHNGVYDVTKYLDEHPGGVEALLTHAGLDGTNDFEDVGHSDDAREIMKKYKIGELAPGEQNKFSTARKCCSDPPKSEKTWRTYDGSPSSIRSPSVSPTRPPASPQIERRVPAIIVPRESPLKYALLALAGALVVGFILKKYLAGGGS